MNEPLICRLKLDIVVGALFIGGMIVSFPTLIYFTQTVAPPTISVSLTIIWTLALLGATLIPILWCWWHCRIIADETALEIRGIFYRRVIPWETIHDYYLELGQASNNGPIASFMCIAFGTRKFKFNFFFDKLPELKDAIEQHATNARARKFELKEKLDINNAPQIFAYDNPQIWLTVLAGVGLVFLMVLMPYINMLTTGGMGAIQALSAGYTRSMLFVSLAEALLRAVLGLLLFLPHIPRIKKTRQFAGQTISVSKSGLAWQSGADKTEIPWTEVERYYIESIPGHLQGNLCVVEGKRERITFLYAIPKGDVLRKLITQYAPSANTTKWQHAPGRSSDLLGPAATPNADGSMIFHYKTRSNRAVLVLGLIICAPFIASVFRIGPEPVNLILLVLTSVPVSCCWLTYLRAKLEINREGITHSTPFGKKFVAWNQIQNLKSATFYSIESTAGTMRISQFLAESERFQEAVTQRTGKIWERPAYEKQYQLEE